MVQAREVLKQIVSDVEQFIDPVAVAAKDVGGDAMKLLLLSQLHSPPDYRGMSEFNIGVEKKNVVALCPGRSQVAAHGRHSPANYAYVQTIAKAEHNLWRTVARVGISHQHFRTRHLRVVLLRQRSQQTRNQRGLVLGWNHDR